MRYVKLAIPALVAGLLALGAALTDDTVTVAEWISVAVAFLGAPALYAKTPPASADEEPRTYR